MPRNYYKAPKAELDNSPPEQRSRLSFRIAFKASAVVCAIFPAIIAILSIFDAPGPRMLTGLTSALTTYLVTALIALIATLTYGKLVENFLLKMQIYTRTTMILGGALPSILLCLFESFLPAIIIGLYAIPIAFLCHHLIKASPPIPQ
ncbi:hypothetical protein ACJJIF_07410 [Microbulbifer sp. SSSA002]|uniref:hypothetical protein n=1 Tax=unclassified Microbulbifer TaxID=2619833 RepID=UPI0040390AB7